MKKKRQPPKKKQPSAASQLRFKRRLDVVMAVQRGEHVNDVAEMHGVDVRSVFRWLELYRSGGEQALRDGARSGRPRKLTDKMLAKLYRMIVKGDPRQFMFEFSLWTLNIIRALIKREWNISLSKSSVSRLMAQLGLSAQVPTYRSNKRDQKSIDRYLNRVFPQIRRRARELGAVIYFVDEASVRADAHRGTTWGKIGDTPVVEDSGDRFTVNMVSGVSPRGDMKFRVFEGSMNEDKYLDFLVCLWKDTGKPIIVVCDNARYHKTTLVKKCAETSGGAVTLYFLPPYSPELNPDEQVWNHTKAKIGRKFVETKECLVKEVKKALKSIQKRTELIMSFFRLDGTKYAADSC
jgi:transposase